MLEDGKPQPVVAFAAVDIPSPPPVAAEWMRQIGSDVATNQLDLRRIVVIIMDDGMTSPDDGVPNAAKQIARGVIDRLGPNDLAAVVFTFIGKAQNFTADRRQLIAAADSFAPKAIPVPGRWTAAAPEFSRRAAHCRPAARLRDAGRRRELPDEHVEDRRHRARGHAGRAKDDRPDQFRRALQVHDGEPRRRQRHPRPAENVHAACSAPTSTSTRSIRVASPTKGSSATGSIRCACSPRTPAAGRRSRPTRRGSRCRRCSRRTAPTICSAFVRRRDDPTTSAASASRWRGLARTCGRGRDTSRQAPPRARPRRSRRPSSRRRSPGRCRRGLCRSTSAWRRSRRPTASRVW